MRRVMLTLAAVLVATVVELEAQGHGAPAAHAPKADPHAKAAPEPKPSGKAAASPPDLGTVLERINKQVGTVVTDMNKSRPARHAAPAAQSKKTPAPQVASHARAATTQPTPHPRVELDWHTPLLVWPEELLRP